MPNRSTLEADGDTGMETNLYLFCAAVGVPLLLWFVLAGDGDGGEGFGDADGGDGLLGFLPLSALASLLGILRPRGPVRAFDFTGAHGVVAVRARRRCRCHRSERSIPVPCVGCAATHRPAKSWIMSWKAPSPMSLPISTEHGQDHPDQAGAREQMTAAPVDGSTINAGERVVIVGIEHGVALVAPLGPELE